MQVREQLFAAFAHATAIGAIIALTLVLTVLGYFGLLAWAVIAGSPIGSPIALIGMLAIAFVASFLAAGFVLFPVTLATAVLCDRLLKWPRVAQIPVATVLCFVEVVALSLVIAAIRRADLIVAVGAGSIVWLVLLVPLGIYWWALQFNEGVKWVSTKLWSRVRRMHAARRGRWPAV